MDTTSITAPRTPHESLHSESSSSATPHRTTAEPSATGRRVEFAGNTTAASPHVSPSQLSKLKSYFKKRRTTSRPATMPSAGSTEATPQSQPQQSARSRAGLGKIGRLLTPACFGGASASASPSTDDAPAPARPGKSSTKPGWFGRKHTHKDAATSSQPEAPPTPRGSGRSDAVRGTELPVVTEEASSAPDTQDESPVTPTLRRWNSAPEVLLRLTDPPAVTFSQAPSGGEVSSGSAEPSDAHPPLTNSPSTASKHESDTETVEATGTARSHPLRQSEIQEIEELEHEDVSDEADARHPTTPPQDIQSREQEPPPIPVAPGHPANMLREAHLQTNPHPYRSNVETNILGLRATSRPAQPFSLPKEGRRQNPVPPATPAAADLAPPPSATPVKGMRKRNVRHAASSFVSGLLPAVTRQAKAAHAPSQLSNAGTEVLPLTQTAGLNARIQQIFGSAGRDESRAALAEKLRAALELPETDRAAPASATELAFTHHTLIAERLAQVTGGDADRALAALDALTEGQFLPFPTVAFAAGTEPARLEQFLTLPRGRPTLAQPQLDALSTAARLASSPSGFEAVLRALKPTLPEERQPGFKRLLEAVATIEAEEGAKGRTERHARGDIASHTMLARALIEKNDASLAQEVLHIESAALEHPGAPYAALTVKEKAALFSWNNGFRERGDGTPLAKVQGRIAKMGKYVQRANHLQQLRNVSFERQDKVRSSLKVVDAQLRILAMRAQQSVGRKKVPFGGLRKFGVENNWLRHPDDDVKVLDDNAKTAIRQLREHYDEAVKDKRQFQRLLMDQRAKELPAPVLHAALLEHWETQMERGQLRPLGIRLDSAALSTIAEKIAARYDVRASQSLIERRLKNWAGAKLVRNGLSMSYRIDRELTVQDLKKWAKGAHVATATLTPIGEAIANGASPRDARELSTSAAAAATASPTHFEETEFGTALRKAMAVVDSSAIVPDDLTADGLHRFTRTYLLEHNWGNPVTASNGGTFGINTAAVSASIHELSQHLLPVSAMPIFDLKLSRSNNAVLIFGSTTHGGEIFLGTQRQMAGSLGLGLSVVFGPKFLKKIIGQAAFSGELTPLAAEHVKTRGVMVRSLRLPNADRTAFDSAAARAELVKVNDLIWSIAKGEHGTLSPEQVWEKIAEHFFDSPTLSIGWQDQEALNLHHTANVAASARGGLAVNWVANQFSQSEIARTAVGGSLTSDLTTVGANRRREDTGQNRLMRANQQWRITHMGALNATATTPTIPLSDAHGALTATLASGATQVAQTFQLSDRGFNATFRAILKTGKLSEPYTLREFEERQARAFVDFLTDPTRQAQFIQVFKAAFGEDNGEQEFGRFLQKTGNWAGPGQHYVTRYRILADERRALDELAATAHAIHERNPHDPLLRDIEKAMKARLENEDSWVPTQAYTLEGQTARDALGVNLGIQFNAQESVATDRELSVVAVPLPIAKEWTRARKDVRIGDPSVRQGLAEHNAGV